MCIAEYGLNDYGDLTWQQLAYTIDYQIKVWEDGWKQSRMLMWLYAESKRDSKKQPQAFKPSDFVRLPSDTFPESDKEAELPDIERIKNKYGN